MKRKVLSIAIMAIAVIIAVIQINKSITTTVLLKANIEAMTDDEAGGYGPVNIVTCYANTPTGNGDLIVVCPAEATLFRWFQGGYITNPLYPCPVAYTRPDIFTSHGLCYISVSQ